MTLKCFFFQIIVSKVYRSVVLKKYEQYMIFINKLQISWRLCFNVLTQKCVSFRGMRADLTVQC